jgi:hypothetical protein
MTVATHKAIKKSLSDPDFLREADNTKLECAILDDVGISRFTLQPGWKWSRDVRPLMGTDSCQLQHIQYVIRGRIQVRMDDGSELEFGPGDCALIPPGHDAEVVGDEPFVAIDFSNDVKECARMEHPGGSHS